MKQTILGVVNNREQAERLVSELQTQGFLSQDISILFANERSAVQRTTASNVSSDTSTSSTTTRRTVLEEQTKAPKGATAGAVVGGVVGGTLGLLVGIGSIAIPGLGPFIAAGPLMAALAGSGVGGSVGVVVGALVGMGIPEEEAKRIESSIKSNNFLVALQVDTVQEVNRARDIFKQMSARDITVSAEKSASRF